MFNRVAEVRLVKEQKLGIVGVGLCIAAFRVWSLLLHVWPFVRIQNNSEPESCMCWR
mgnify:CR=1 FL=1